MSLHADFRDPGFWSVVDGLRQALGSRRGSGLVLTASPNSGPGWTMEFTDWDGRERVALVQLVGGPRA